MQSVYLFLVLILVLSSTLAIPPSERAPRATILQRHKKVNPARQHFLHSLRGDYICYLSNFVRIVAVKAHFTYFHLLVEPQASSRITEAEKNQLPIFKKLNLVREWLVHDGNLETKPTANIGWIALAVLFYLLAPILIPLFLSPVIVLVGFFVFLPIIIDNDAYAWRLCE